LRFDRPEVAVAEVLASVTGIPKPQPGTSSVADKAFASGAHSRLVEFLPELVHHSALFESIEKTKHHGLWQTTASGNFLQRQVSPGQRNAVSNWEE